MDKQELTSNSTNKETADSWFADFNLKTSLIIVALSSLFGIGGGAGIVATKAVAVSAAGISEEKADVKYLTRDEWSRVRAERDLQNENFRREIKTDIEKTLKKETFEVWQKTWDERQKNFDEKLDRILERK